MLTECLQKLTINDIQKTCLTEPSAVRPECICLHLAYNVFITSCYHTTVAAVQGANLHIKFTCSIEITGMTVY